MSSRKKNMNKGVFQTAKELCRELRKRSTRSEQIFWAEVPPSLFKSKIPPKAGRRGKGMSSNR